MGLIIVLILAVVALVLFSTRKKSHHEIVGDHVIVIGSGFSGMVHAKVLSKRFKKVTIIERDSLSSQNSDLRRGVPQGAQFHMLMAKGVQIITRLFPTSTISVWKPDLHTTESNSTSLTFVYCVHHGPIGPFYDGYGCKLFPCTRPVLERILREELLETTPNLEIIDNTTVTDIVFDSERSTVKGVCILQDQEESEILSDLVVDCSGANTKQNSASFLKKRGVEFVIEEVDAGIGYTSALYTFNGKSPSITLRGRKEDLSLFMIQPKPDEGTVKGFAMCSVEDEKWNLMWCAFSKNYPPTEEAELLEWMKEVPHYQYIQEIMAQAKRVTEFKPHRGIKSRRIRLDKISNFPDGLLITGDAIASFTPTYGQGMTFACMCAEALEESLGMQTPFDLRGLGKNFFKKAQTPSDLCWASSSGQDFTVPGVQSNIQPPPGSSFVNGYFDYVFKVCAQEHNKEVWGIFIKVISMLSNPVVMFSPKVVLPVIKMIIKDNLNRFQSQHKAK